MERHVDEVLRVKGREVASISPEATVLAAVRSMNEKRIGSWFAGSIRRRCGSGS